MSKRFKYSFAQKQQTDDGNISVIVAALSLFLLVLCFFISFMLAGGASAIVGAVGLMSICLSAYSFILGLRSFKERDRQHTSSAVGAISGGITMLLWFTLFLIGI